MPDPDADMGLGDVVMLRWTTRAPEGLLGHAREPNTMRIDPHRRVIDGTPRFVPNDQHLRVVLTTAQSADLGAGVGPLSVAAGAARATHVAYDVTVTGYLELPPDSLQYNKASGCCIAGAVSNSCGGWYVVRLMRGTGTAQYLQKLDVNAAVDGLDIVKARGGSTFQRLNEMSFKDAYFAYEVVQLSGLCNQVPPGEELETLAVQAPHNCWVQALQADGTRVSHSWYMQSPELCTAVAQGHCRQLAGTAHCHVSFGGQEARAVAAPPGAGPPAAASAGARAGAVEPGPPAAAKP